MIFRKRKGEDKRRGEKGGKNREIEGEEEMKAEGEGGERCIPRVMSACHKNFKYLNFEN